jgi:iron complex outermembrane recepter protein
MAPLTARVERADAWQVSDSRPEDHNGRGNNFMGRLLVKFEPSDSIRIGLSVNGWEDHSQTQAAQYNAFQPATPGRTPALVEYEYAFAPEDPRAADWNVGIPLPTTACGKQLCAVISIRSAQSRSPR